MRVQLPKAIFLAFAMSTLVVSACSSGSSESASPVATTPAAESVEAAETPGDYKIGDTGPGGGIVFFDAGSVQPWGRYFEAGPQLAPTEWCGEDWDELNVVYEQRDIIGGFGIGNDGSSFDAYWSSTQSDAGTTGFTDVVWTQYFDGGEQQGTDCKCNFYGVLPVRAF